ncbi:MAG: C40 family peptidase, partial [Alphaproteobacteria bacterium]|nr:C40 family peptidase [Alphaproteobacteria bacterium]
MHPRLLASNGRVAHVSLDGLVEADAFVSGNKKQIRAPITDLLRNAGGALDRQLLYGSGFLELEHDIDAGFSFGLSESDGYVGYVRSCDLVAPQQTTHKVSALASHIYQYPDLKSPVLSCLYFASVLAVKEIKNGYAALISGGFVPAQHVQPLNLSEPDFVAVIERFLGVPYLWGGNSAWGVDCSGVVQLALQASAKTCPRDADMQVGDLGELLANDADLRRGDLIFWRGHIGVMQDAQRLIHANAFHMAVVSENLGQAVTRIEASGG